MSRSDRRHQSEEGAAMLEMAITLPLLLLVAVGIFEFGRAYQFQQVLTNASREGARVAVLPGITDAAVTARVNQYLTVGNLNPSAATVTIVHTVPINLGGMTVTGSSVTVDYPLNFMVLKPVAQLVAGQSTTTGDPLTLSASATMRNE